MLLPVTATVREAPELLALFRANPHDEIVDCARLERCDVAGLQLLIAHRDALAARGARVRVINVPEDLTWRFAFAGLVPTEMTNE